MRQSAPRQQNQAKNYVAAPSAVMNTEDAEIGQSNERVMRSTGDSEDSLDKVSLIKVMDQPYGEEKMAMLAFMNEQIEIQIGQTGDKNAAQIFEINVNGQNHLFRRGQIKTVPRYIVDRMLRLKETRYEQREVMDADGVRQFVHTPINSLKYDFAITRDDNPLGRSWHQAVLAEQA